MSKLGKELKAEKNPLVLNSDGRRRQCNKCRSKALKKSDAGIKCCACGNIFK